MLATEAEDGAQLAESLVKQITGGDKLVARFLYHNAFEYDPAFKLFLITNHQPIVKGDDHAIWRRIRLIPFDITIPEEQRDHKLQSQLLAELPGILNWAVEGCLAWQREGLNPPPCVVVATMAYRSDMDILGDWIDECCVTGATVLETITPVSHLYASFEQWASASDLRAMSRNAFSRSFTNEGSRVCAVRGLAAFAGSPCPRRSQWARNI